MADTVIYFYNERGYLQSSRMGAVGGTTTPPLTGLDLPAGKYNRWSDDHWVADIADPGPQEGTAATNDRELVVALYRVKNPFTGASLGDLLTSARVMDVSTDTASQIGPTVWFNESTGANLPVVPSALDIEAEGTPGLTDTQLRASPVPVQGGVAAGAADSGNPLKIGGKYNAVLPTYADGQRGDGQLDTKGGLLVVLKGSGGTLAAGVGTANADGLAAASNGVFAQGMNYVFNGASWDRVRGDTNGQWLQGNVGSGVADTGNPVKMGGVANSGAPALVLDGQRVNRWLTQRGASVMGARPVAAADASSNTLGWVDDTTGAARLFAQSNFVFNGVSWDRQRGDVNGTWTQGNVASGTADAGAPVKTGGVANSGTPVAVLDNQRVNTWMSLRGATIIGGRSSAGADATSNSLAMLDDNLGAARLLAQANFVYNGATWDRQRGDANGNWMQGNVASNTLDAGNPVKIGGVVRANPSDITLTAGRRGDASMNTSGALYVQATDQFGQQMTLRSPTSDGLAGTAGFPVYSHTAVWNGASWDRMRGNTTSGLLVNTAGETYSQVTIMGVTTDGITGSNFVAFASQSCTALDIVNNSTVDIEYRRGGTGNTLRIKAGNSRLVQGITNASQISVRRVDLSNAPAVTIEAEAFLP